MSSGSSTIIKAVIAYVTATLINIVLDLSIYLKFQHFMFNHFSGLLERMTVHVGDTPVSLFWMGFYFFANFFVFSACICVIALAFKSNRPR